METSHESSLVSETIPLRSCSYELEELYFGGVRDLICEDPDSLRRQILEEDMRALTEFQFMLCQFYVSCNSIPALRSSNLQTAASLKATFGSSTELLELGSMSLQLSLLSPCK